jgi:hypothetical protein
MEHCDPGLLNYDIPHHYHVSIVSRSPVVPQASHHKIMSPGHSVLGHPLAVLWIQLFLYISSLVMLVRSQSEAKLDGYFITSNKWKVQWMKTYNKYLMSIIKNLPKSNNRYEKCFSRGKKGVWRLWITYPVYLCVFCT